MPRCFHCKLDGDDASFYPNAPVRAWCKRCINERRGKAVCAFKREANRAECEQAAICHVIADLQPAGVPFVYLLRAGGRFKIGFSTNVATRIRSFGTGREVALQVVAVAPGGRLLERELHRRYANYRIAREWFAFRQEILRGFKELPGSFVFLPGCMTQESSRPSSASTS